MNLCQTSCLRCLWKPSPGGLSRQDPTLPKRSPRVAPCLLLHSSRKRAPGNDRLRARTSSQGALYISSIRLFLFSFKSLTGALGALHPERDREDIAWFHQLHQWLIERSHEGKRVRCLL